LIFSVHFLNCHYKQHLQCAPFNQWRTQKFSEGLAKFRHNRVTSQINFKGSAEGTTIQGVRGMSPGKFCKIKICIFVL